MNQRTAALLTASLTAVLASGLALCLVSCGEQTATKGTVTESKDTEKVDAGAVEDASSSCKGVAQEHRRRFSQYDHQCGFLSDCATSGKCSCGAGCGKDVQMCNGALCKDVNATCYCGNDCIDSPAKKPLCPEFFCKDNGKHQADGCHALQHCTFVDSEQDAKCQCTTMSDHAPTCWCGDTCAKTKASCSAALCFGKNPNTCIVVPGSKYDNCYCATCGLKANSPACFFVLCP